MLNAYIGPNMTGLMKPARSQNEAFREEASYLPENTGAKQRIFRKAPRVILEVRTRSRA
jgi:hypothetical protein